MARLLAVAAALGMCGVAAAAGLPYDEGFAKLSAHFAGAAYCHAPEIYGWNGTVHAPALPGFEVYGVQYVEEDDMQSFVGYWPKDDMIVISFRGTVASSLIDWIDDLKTWLEKANYPGCAAADCKVHDGFYQTWLKQKSQVTSALQAVRAKHPNSALLVTGHSLGAALASLCAADLVTDGMDKATHVYTYGQPRVGDPAWYSWYKDNVVDTNYRVVHYHDIVPHLPPELLGFHHEATEVWYSDEACTQHIVCDGSGEDSKCSDSVALPISISDHLHYFGIPLTSSVC